MIRQLFFFATAVLSALASAEGSAYNRFTLSVDTPISGLVWNQLMFFNGMLNQQSIYSLISEVLKTNE